VGFFDILWQEMGMYRAMLPYSLETNQKMAGIDKVFYRLPWRLTCGQSGVFADKWACSFACLSATSRVSLL